MKIDYVMLIAYHMGALNFLVGVTDDLWKKIRNRLRICG